MSVPSELASATSGGAGVGVVDVSLLGGVSGGFAGSVVVGTGRFAGFAGSVLAGGGLLGGSWGFIGLVGSVFVGNGGSVGFVGDVSGGRFGFGSGCASAAFGPCARAHTAHVERSVTVIGRMEVSFMT
jgi:hypothetical protein